MRTPKMMGFMKELLTIDTVLDPAKAATRAIRQSTPRSFQCSFTRLAYCTTAEVVQDKDGILVVPSRVATEWCGRVII